MNPYTHVRQLCYNFSTATSWNLHDESEILSMAMKMLRADADRVRSNSCMGSKAKIGSLDAEIPEAQNKKERLTMSKMTSKDFFDNQGKEASIKGYLEADDPKNMYKGYSGEMIGIDGSNRYTITEAAFVVGHKKSGPFLKLLRHGDLQRSGVKKIEMIYDVKMEAFGMKITDVSGKASYISTLTCERTQDFVMLGYFFFKEEKTILVLGMVGACQPKLIAELYEVDELEHSCFKHWIMSMMEVMACQEQVL